MSLNMVRTMASEIGSARNGHRPKLLKVLADPAVTTVVVEHRERLVRFGLESVESAPAATGRSIIVIEPAEVADDLVRDRTEVLTSFCARQYGRRSAARRAREAVRAIQETQEETS
jgi:putative resolvase